MAELSGQGLLLLPDRLGKVAVEAGNGPVRAVHPAAFAVDTAAELIASDSQQADVAAVRTRWRTRLESGEDAAWRGLLACALLCDLWGTDPVLSTLTLRAEHSPLCEAVLRSTGWGEATLLLLRREDREAVLGLVDAEMGLVPAADLNDLTGLLPEEVTWYTRDGKVFTDPCESLCEMDRRRLSLRLSLLPNRCEAVDRFVSALAETAENHIAACAAGEERSAWMQRIRTIAGIQGENAFAELTSERLTRRESGHNALLNALQVDEPLLPASGCTRWRWRGTPIAVDSMEMGLEMAHTAEEAEALSELDQQERLLAAHSPSYRAVLPERMRTFAAERMGGMAQPLQNALHELTEEAERLAIAIPETLTAIWPYDANAPAMRSLLAELLGEEALPALAAPFSDWLTCLPGAALGDALMDQACRVELTGQMQLVLPPLSEPMAAWLSQTVWPVQPFQPDSLRFTPLALGRVRVTLHLTGHGHVSLQRTYEPAALTMLEAVPHIGLWPAVRPARQPWRYYLLSVTGDTELGLMQADGWERLTVTTEDGEKLVQTDTWPDCLSLWIDGQCAGILPNLMPLTHLPEAGHAIAAIEPGNATLSLALRVSGQVTEASLPVLWKPLLTPGGNLPRFGKTPREALPALLPHELLCEEDISEAQPFVSGHIPLPGEGADTAPEASLLLREDEKGEAAETIALREAMLLLALCAVLRGAQNLSWRLAYPATFTDSRAKGMLRTLTEAATWAGTATGFPLRREEGTASVRASLAEALWLRNVEPVSALAVVDIGSSATVLSVLLPGVQRPAFEKALDTGLAAMLTASLSLRPEWLGDFSTMDGVTVSALRRYLTAPAGEEGAISQIWHGIDQLFGDRLAEASALMNAHLDTATPCGVQALLLFGYAQRFTLLGMGLEELYRTPVLGDRLPGSMRLFLTGRGSLPLLAMDERLRAQLKRFLRLGMNQRHPIRTVQWTPSPACRMEGALMTASLDSLEEGMPDISRVGGMSLGQVLVNFMLLFRAAFPEACDCLFRPLFELDGSLTRDAWEGLVALAQEMDGDTAEDFLNCMQTVLTDTIAVQRRAG